MNPYAMLVVLILTISGAASGYYEGYSHAKVKGEATLATTRNEWLESVLAGYKRIAGMESAAILKNDELEKQREKNKLAVADLFDSLGRLSISPQAGTCIASNSPAAASGVTEPAAEAGLLRDKLQKAFDRFTDGAGRLVHEADLAVEDCRATQ